MTAISGELQASSVHRESEAVLARVERSLAAYRRPVAEELVRIIPDDPKLRDALYDPIREHALRPGKGLRPAICIATCRALGGGLEAALPTAAVLEMFHNAFLVHDDIEDGSLLRRDGPTMHAVYGTAIAVNAGDAMLALALRPLLENTRVIGLGKALRVLETVAEMVQEAAEGQALELDWIRHGSAAIEEADYVTVVEKKTASYSFVAPAILGAIIAGAPRECIDLLGRFARRLGVAFQIRDDVLNLRAGDRWGKDSMDDLWEGKRTLVLAHAVRSATSVERARATQILLRPRPTPRAMALAKVIADLEHAAQAAPEVRTTIEAAVSTLRDSADGKNVDDVAFLMELIDRAGSLDYADGVAERMAAEAAAALADCTKWLGPSVHAAFLSDLVEYVRQRDH